MLKSNPNKVITFKQHTHICVKGDALTPSRMWNITLLNEDEYDKLSPGNKATFRTIKQSDLYTLEMHFGKEDEQC